MGKHERTNDGFYSKVIIASIVVIWVSLVGGGWLGHYVVEKGLLGQSSKQEYSSRVQQKPKPWITVDPHQQQELERLQGNSGVFFSQPTPSPFSPTPAASGAPEEPVVTASPVDELPATPAPAVTPEASPVADNSEPLPTPAELGEGRYHLQFGSFNSHENAQSMVDSLSALGQDAQVEEIDSANGKKVYRVRGGDYTEEQARQQRDKLQEQSIKAFIVNSQ